MVENSTFCCSPTTHRHAEEVGLVHHVQHQLAHLPVLHGEVVVLVLPLLDAQELHHPGKGPGDDPDAVVGEAMELAGLHALLLQLAAVLPLVLLGGLDAGGGGGGEEVRRRRRPNISLTTPHLQPFLYVR